MANVETAACPDRETLARLLRGLLEDDEIGRLDRHLAECQRCCGHLRALEVDDALIEAVRGAADIDRLPDDEEVRELIGRLKTLRLSPPPAGPGNTIALQGELTDSDAWGLDGLLDVAESPGELGRLAGYRVLRVLGAGGMGLVLAAEDPRLARPVAIKVMDRRLAARDDFRQRFLQEARAAAAIEHPHVVAVHQVGEHREIPYLAMQLLEGESLEERIAREGRLPLDACLRIGREIAEALAAAHRRGLVHRDIKPANVWLQSPGDVVKLLDFGLARFEGLTRMTHTGLVLGTPAYMSPEQARGDAAGPAGDLFSLGAVLYRIATGREPFSGPTTLAVLTALAIEYPTPPRELNPAIPPPFADLIVRLLAKKPEHRPRSAEAVVAELNALEPVTAGKKQRTVAPRKTRASLLAACTAIVVIGLLATLWRNSPKRETAGGWPSQAVPSKKTDHVVQTAASADHHPIIPLTDEAAEAAGGEKAVAAWALGLGGRVNDGPKGLEQLADIRYPIYSLILDHTAIDDASLQRLLECPYLQRLGLRETQVSGAGLRHLSRLHDLQLLGLEGNRQLTDGDLDEITRIRSLTTINLNHTSITLAGLHRLADLPRLLTLSARGIADSSAGAGGERQFANRAAGLLLLNDLDLSGAAIRDHDLPRLATMTGLLSLNLTATNVADAAVSRLHQSLGDCWIVGADGQTHPPPSRPGDPDRVAAERLLEIGYQITIARPHQQIVSAASELPADGFRLTWVGPGPRTCGDEELRLLTPCRQLSVVHIWGSKPTSTAGVASLRGLTKLAHLNLSDLPLISDDVLPLLADLPSLRTVGFRGDRITDAALRRLPYLPDLEFLDLSGTLITGAALKYLHSVPRLRQLVLAQIALNDADLKPLDALSELDQLDLAGTDISGAALEHLKPLGHLQRMVLSRDRLVDADADRLTGFVELTQLALDGTQIGDAGLARLTEKLKNLEWLNLRDTAVSAASLPTLRRLPRLRHLILGGANWPDAAQALAVVGRLQQLEKLEIAGQDITDAALRSLHRLERLQSLTLYNTEVTSEGLGALKAALPACSVNF